MLCYVKICTTDLSQYSVSIIQLDRGPLWVFYEYKHTLPFKWMPSCLVITIQDGDRTKGTKQQQQEQNLSPLKPHCVFSFDDVLWLSMEGENTSCLSTRDRGCRRHRLSTATKTSDTALGWQRCCQLWLGGEIWTKTSGRAMELTGRLLFCLI